MEHVLAPRRNRKTPKRFQDDNFIATGSSKPEILHNANKKETKVNSKVNINHGVAKRGGINLLTGNKSSRGKSIVEDTDSSQNSPTFSKSRKKIKNEINIKHEIQIDSEVSSLVENSQLLLNNGMNIKRKVNSQKKITKPKLNGDEKGLKCNENVVSIEEHLLNGIESKSGSNTNSSYDYTKSGSKSPVVGMRRSSRNNLISKDIKSEKDVVDDLSKGYRENQKVPVQLDHNQSELISGLNLTPCKQNSGKLCSPRDFDLHNNRNGDSLVFNSSTSAKKRKNEEISHGLAKKKKNMSKSPISGVDILSNVVTNINHYGDNLSKGKVKISPSKLISNTVVKDKRIKKSRTDGPDAISNETSGHLKMIKRMLEKDKAKKPKSFKSKDKDFAKSDCEHVPPNFGDDVDSSIFCMPRQILPIPKLPNYLKTSPISLSKLDKESIPLKPSTSLSKSDAKKSIEVDSRETSKDQDNLEYANYTPSPNVANIIESVIHTSPLMLMNAKYRDKMESISKHKRNKKMVSFSKTRTEIHTIGNESASDFDINMPLLDIPLNEGKVIESPSRKSKITEKSKSPKRQKEKLLSKEIKPRRIKPKEENDPDCVASQLLVLRKKVVGKKKGGNKKGSGRRQKKLKRRRVKEEIMSPEKGKNVDKKRKHGKKYSVTAMVNVKRINSSSFFLMPYRI